DAGAGPERAGRHGRAGHAARLHDRRARAASGAGGRVEGRAEGHGTVRERPEPAADLGRLRGLDHPPRGFVPSRTARNFGNAALQTSARAMPTKRMKAPLPKRIHCTSFIGTSDFGSLASAWIS